MSSDSYLLAGRASELDRLQLQSRVWEPAGRRLLDEIGDGQGARALDVGCSSMGWLRLLSEWVGPGGEVVGTDIDEAMLAAAEQFVTTESLGNVTLVKDDLFASELEPSPFTWCMRGSNWPRWGVGQSKWLPTFAWSVRAAPWYWKSWALPPGTSSRLRPHWWCS